MSKRKARVRAGREAWMPEAFLSGMTVTEIADWEGVERLAIEAVLRKRLTLRSQSKGRK